MNMGQYELDSLVLGQSSVILGHCEPVVAMKHLSCRAVCAETPPDMMFTACR